MTHSFSKSTDESSDDSDDSQKESKKRKNKEKEDQESKKRKRRKINWQSNDKIPFLFFTDMFVNEVRSYRNRDVVFSGTIWTLEKLNIKNND